MKTESEWMEQFKKINNDFNRKYRPHTQREIDNHVERLNDFFKQIQLDAVADKDKAIAHLCEDSVKFQEDLKKALGLTDKDCHDGNGDITEEAILNAILNAIPKRIN